MTNSEKNNSQENKDENINLYEKSTGVIIDNEQRGDIKADIVKMTNSTAKNISTKNSAKLDQSCAKNIVTKEISANQSAAFKVNAEKANFNKSVTVLNDSEQTTQENSLNITSISDTVNAKNMNNILSYSSETNADQIKSAVFIGKKVNGNVTTLLDSKTAAIIGAFFGLALFILRILFRKR